MSTQELASSYTVRILPQDCNGEYMDVQGCGLFNAIKRQLPTFPLHDVGGNVIQDKNGNIWDFPDTWGVNELYDLKEGKQPYFDLTITLRKNDDRE